MKICGNCGTNMEPDQKFCDKCGHRYVEPHPPSARTGKKRGKVLPRIMIIAIVLAVTGGIVIIQLHRASVMTMNLGRQKTMYLAREYAREWDGKINGYIQVLQTLSNMMNFYESIAPDMRRQTYENMLRSVFEDMSDFVQMFTVWKPNAIDGMDTRYTGRVGSTPTGQFAFALTRETGEIKPMTSQVVDEVMQHITGPDGRTVGISDPSPFKIMGKDTLTVRIVIPIINKRTNEIVGDIGCQLDIGMIQSMAEQTIKDLDEVSGMAIYTNSGFILANYLPEKIGKQLSDVETQYGSYLNEVKQAISNAQEWEGTVYDPVLKTNMVMAIANIPIRVSPTTWSVMIGTSESYIMKDAKFW